MKDLIAIFRMNEIKPKTRARIIVKLGKAINHEYGANITEAIVYELVALLDPSSDILKDKHYSEA